MVPVKVVGVLAVDPAGVLTAELGGKKGVVPFEFGAVGSPEGIVICAGYLYAISNDESASGLESDILDVLMTIIVDSPCSAVHSWEA